VIPWEFVKGHGSYVLLKGLLEDPKRVFLFYQGLFDTQFLWAEGIDVKIGGDVMLKTYLDDERNNMHSLKGDAARYLDASDWESDIKQYAPKREDSYENVPLDKLTWYNGQDVMHTQHLDCFTDELFEEDEKTLEPGERGLRWVYENVLVPSSNMLARARYHGIRVDLHRVKELQDTFVPLLDEVTQQLIDLTGNRLYNPNSHQDKLAALHTRGIKVPNTRRETLEEFWGDELVDLMREYSEAHKMYSTYIVGIVDDVYDDLKVHCDFKMTGTETGRLSAKDPNLLGMPRKAEEYEHKWKRVIKEIFIAEEGCLLAHLDQKQSEVRVACFLAMDQALLEVLKKGGDVHGEMAALVYGVGYTKEQRVWAKMIVFGLIYNREAPSLARQLKTTVRKAQEVIDSFFEKLQGLLSWKRRTMHRVHEKGYLRSHLGRKRRFGMLTPQNRKHVMNEAVNFPISSVSSDINLLNCVEADKKFSKYGVKVLVPIHDAGLLSIPKKEQSIVPELVGLFEELPNRYLEGFKVPFKVDAALGERWSDL
jgi:DNA polymerase-1